MLRLLMIMGITVAGLIACDSLSDPSKSAPPPASAPPNTSTTLISGQLIGASVPPNTRVTLVWETKTAIEHGVDVPAVDGRFTMELGVPPTDAILDDREGVLADHIPDDTLTVPVGRAGFIVYVDANNNQELDLDDDGVPSDQIVGGSTSLVLTYLADATAKEYAPLRDDTKTLPHGGYNLLAIDGERRAWSPLDRVDLALAKTQLPEQVCFRLRSNDYEGLQTKVSDTPTSCDWNQRSYEFLTCWTRASSSLCADPNPGTRQCSSGARILVPEGEPMPVECGKPPGDAGP
jgi:hypothetical protein